MADGGTLLDKVSELPMNTQVKLLRVPPEGEFGRAHILSTLKKTNRVIAGEQGAAVQLGINPNKLRSRITRLGTKRSATAE